MGVMSRILKAIRAPKNLRGISTFATSFWMDKYRRKKVPNATELMQMFLETAYTCANMNAQSVAGAKFRLYVPGKPDKVDRVFGPKAVSSHKTRWLSEQPALKSLETRDLTEITAHPALELLLNPSPFFDGFNLLYLTQLYKEIVGRSVWQLTFNALTKTPEAVWPIPANQIEPVVTDGSALIKGFRLIGKTDIIPMDQLVVTGNPHPENPYSHVWSPMLAASQSIGLMDLDVALAWSYMMNRARPDVWVSPKEGGGIDEDEAERMFERLQKLYHQGGDGGVMITDQPVTTSTIGYNMREMDQIKRVMLHTERVYNIFGIPQAFGTTKTNLANIQAAMTQYSKFAVYPRLVTLCQALTQQYIRKWDNNAFLWFDNPIPEDVQQIVTTRESYLRTGQRVVNEFRQEDGLAPVKWGNEPMAMPATPIPGGPSGREGKPEDDGKKSYDDPDYDEE